MKNQCTDYLTSFADHLDEQYGLPGTPTREEFEEDFEILKQEALAPQNPS